MRERAFFGWSDGRLLVGEGPFEEHPEPPAAGAAFYGNDFGLGRGQPWRVPSAWRLLARDEAADWLTAGEAPTVDWQTPEAGDFAGVFQQITDELRRGSFAKTVPVVVEEGVLRLGDGLALMARALEVDEHLVPYGFGTADAGFCGQSPEYLLRLEGSRLRTMALAGTARIEEREVLAVDEKEIREHEFVVQSLVSKLGELGRLLRGAREVLELGPIVHFHTPIEVALDEPQSVNRLVRLLHPTPALGPMPRTPENLAMLIGWREKLGAPEEFGAPFGAIIDGEFRGIVAIRGLWWRHGRLRLPAGCGVIEASRLVNEWRELRLKREAVKARFGI